MALHGHEINFEFVSWSRAIQQAEMGQIDGIVGGTHEEAPSLVWSGPLFPFVDALAFRSGEAKPVHDAADLVGLRIGVVNDYDYYGAVNEYIVANAGDRSVVQYAAGFEPLSTNLRKLLAGRLDVVAETEAVVLHRAAELGIADQIELYVPEGHGFVEIGFSPVNENSALYARQLREGFETLRERGRVAEVMARYGQ